MSAYEYFDSYEEGKQAPKEFTDALFKTLKKYGLQNILGLRMVHYKSSLLGMETSDDFYRANIINLVPKERFYNGRGKTDYMPTFWMFDTNPDGNAIYWCVSCNSCKYQQLPGNMHKN